MHGASLTRAVHSFSLYASAYSAAKAANKYSKTASDEVQMCVVVGYGRRSPARVETATGSAASSVMAPYQAPDGVPRFPPSRAPVFRVAATGGELRSLPNPSATVCSRCSSNCPGPAVELTDEGRRIHRLAIVIDGHNDLPGVVCSKGDSSCGTGFQPVK